MTDETTARLALPLLQPGQAQKELYHNEALALLDLAVHATVEAVGVDTPPVEPGLGACWIVGSAADGPWTGHINAIAGWTSGGWRFVPPHDGMTVWSRADAQAIRFDAGRWQSGVLSGASLKIEGKQVVGARRAAIDDPAGGPTVDAGARMAIDAILSALREHGLIEA